MKRAICKIVFPKLATALCMAMLLLSAIPGQAQQVLHKHVRPVITNGQAKPVGVLPATQRLKLSILLPLSDPQGLKNFLSDIYDPTSPNYHQFLSVQEFADRFGPTPQDFQTVVDFAKNNGFDILVTPPNRMLVTIEGPVSQIQKTFHVTMTVYQHPTENRTFYSPDREPSLNLNVTVAHIEGLSNYSIPHSTDLRRPTITDSVRTFTTGSGPSGTFLGSDMRAAYYGGSSLTGAGQYIGLFGLAYNINDVTDYFNSVGQSFNPSIVQGVSIDGSATSCTCDDAEQMVDIMRSYSMAPGISGIFEFVGGGNVGTFNAMATHNPLPLNLSSSISYDPEDPTDEEPIFQEFAAQGQSFFQASGDAGAYTSADANGSSYYPAESTWVTPAGGTDLTTNGAGGSWQSETAWSGSGGGPSPDGFAIPSWQVGLANSSNGASSTLRNLPDVASESNTDSYFCDQGSCSGGIGGTSLSAPTWAGFMALVNQQAANNGKPSAGFISPTIATIGKSSSYTSNFHDITSGSNGHNAVTGYDLVTGWGTPNGQTLINTLSNSGSTGPTPTPTPTIKPTPTPTPTACTPSTITPYVQVNGAAWQQTATATVAAGSTVNLGPQPLTGGSWSWTGPNGFTSTSREIDGIPLSSGVNTFVATYTNAGGCVTKQTFTITVTGGATPTPTPTVTPTATPTPTACTPTAITPYVQVNGGAWQQTSTATVAAGASVNLGPQPLNGTWSWTGPNGYTSTSRQIAITVNSTSTYVATYTNTTGCKSTQSFTLTVSGSATQVSLASAFSREGIVTDGTTFSGGLDGVGSAYSSNLLGTTLTFNGASFTFGAANTSNAVSAAGQTITLPAGSFSTLRMLATGVEGNQASQAFVVTYTDGTTTTITQSLSDWFSPQSYSGESVALAMAYRDTGSGTQDARTFNLYGYSLAINNAKTVKSIKLPTNANVEVLALTLVP